MRQAVFIATAAVPPDPQTNAAGRPAVTRQFLPVETGQAGMIWRVASRIFWTRAGRAGADYKDFDVMLPAAARTTAFAHGAALHIRPGEGLWCL